MRENALVERSVDFGARIVKPERWLKKEKRETILSKQILRSGTSVGANINEARYGNSPADLAAKLPAARKETAETEYRLHVSEKQTAWMIKWPTRCPPTASKTSGF